MTPPNAQNAIILIVEDNPDNLFLLKTLLTIDLQVKFCDGRASGAQIFGLLAAKPHLKPDIILLDIHIPGEDGYTVLEQIRKRPFLNNTKVIACTANVMPQDIERARAAHFDGFIGKPIDADRFPDQIRRILAGETVWEAR